MNLALKYRPKQFSDVVGQRATSVILEAMLNKQVLSQVLLFTGASGVGKTSMARIIAAQLNSEGATDVHAGTHPAVLEIDAASNGNVEAIRQLKRDLAYAIEGHRVVIIDEAHAMSAEAFAALLNLLEFPPSHVTFILITTEVHKIPVTIKHRCDVYMFKKASIQELRQRLDQIVETEAINIDSELLDLLAERSEGSFREALMLLEQAWHGSIVSVTEYTELRGEIDYGPSLIASATGGSSMALDKLENILRHTSTEEILDRTIETLRDLIMLKGGLAITSSGQAFDVRKILALKLGSDQLLKAMRIIWDLQTRLSAGDPVRSLELAYSLIGEALKVETHTPAVPTNHTNSTVMSLEAIRNYKG